MTEIPTTEPFTRDVVLRVPRRFDLEIHVSKIDIEDGTYVDVREFIPSLQQYGRGILLPVVSAKEIGDSVYQLAGSLLEEERKRG